MKRSFSLIEILVSLSLMTVLIGSLFFWYNQLTQGKLKLHKEQWPLLEERYCHQRLTKIFSSAQGPFFTSHEKKPNLSAGSLVFTFDRGITDEPLLCGKVLGRLYHDPKDRRLCLGVWPYESIEPSETYVLLTDVDDLAFDFYQPPTGQDFAKSLSSWTRDELPALFYLKLKHHGNKITFAFDLDYPIRYPMDTL